MNQKQGSRRKLLEVAALGASAVAAVGCGSSSAETHPIVVGTAVSDGGLGRQAEDAGTSMVDGGLMGKVAEDAGPMGVSPEEAGTDSGVVVGTAPNDAGEG